VTVGNLFETATDWRLENITDDEHRPGQIKVIDDFMAWIAEGCPRRTFSICMCCRYGKCDACRNLALLAIANKLAGQALVVHPWPELAEQFLEEHRLRDWQKRWLPAGPRLHNIATLRDFSKGSMCNGEWLGSIHVHALLEPMPRALLQHWIEHSRSSHDGVPPIFFFDEGHHFAGGNIWGRVAREVHQAGCLVIPLTAAPYRQDGDDPFGFHRIPTDPEGLPVSRKRSYVTPHPTDGRKLLLHTETRDETIYEISADSEVPFSQGWSEGHIAKATFDLIDWQMKGWGSYRDDDERLLSDLPKEEVRRVLASLYRDPSAIRVAVTHVLRNLDLFRKQSVSDATVIWYGMDDIANGGNTADNLKAIRVALNELDPSLDVRIASLATDDESAEKSRVTIRKFTDNKTKHFDVLLLKQMGALGLDADRICVVVLWNTMRSLGSMIQMAMRGGNTKLKKHFVIVGLKDVLTMERLEAFVKDEGGEFIDAVVTDHQVDEIDKKPTVEGGYIPLAPADVGMGDSDGETATAEEVRLAYCLIEQFETLIAHYTIPKIAKKARLLGIEVPPSETGFRDSEKLCNLYRGNLEAQVRRLGKAMFRKRHGRSSEGTPIDLAEHGELYRLAAQMIKQRAGVFLSWDKSSKERSSNPDDYKAWTMAAEALIEEWS